MTGLRRLLCLPVLLGALMPAAWALDYVSVAAPAILYDSPSSKGKPLYIIKAGTPVEVIVSLEGFVKVRDAQGSLAWLEKKNLGDKRTVLVRAERAQVRKDADDKAAIVFEAEREVVLELTGAAASGWAPVRHRDGQSGFVKASQVFGL